MPSYSQNFSFANLTLFGTESIVGRSLLITVDNTPVCSNIGYPEGTLLLFAPFRTQLVGNVYLRQHGDSSTTSISVSLTVTGPTSLLQWAILPSADSECTISGMAYSLGGVAVGGEDCSPMNQSACEVGDLGGKNGNLTVEGGEVRELITDTNLPLAGLAGLPIAIREEGGSAACAVLLEYRPVSAVAEVSGGGGAGRVEFEQISPTDLTMVSVSGLEWREYWIGQLPPRQDSDCNSTGGIFDPRGVGSSQGLTGDSYQFGDLSGKFGNSTMYSDPYLPLTGRDSIIGRSVVTDSAQLCSPIRYSGPVERITFSVASADFTGTLTLTQPADSPYADTIISVETNFSPDIQVSSSSVSSQVIPTATPSSLTPSQAPSTPSLLMPFPSSPPLPSSTVPITSSSIPMVDDSTILMPMVMLEQTPVMEGGGRRRRDNGDDTGRVKRADMSLQFSWSLRRLPAGGFVSDCSNLDLIGRQE